MESERGDWKPHIVVRTGVHEISGISAEVRIAMRDGD